MADPDALAAWAAGLFEGEGSIRAQRSTVYLELSMTDEDVVRRFHEVTGSGNITKRPRRDAQPAHYKDQWRWVCGEWDDVERLMHRFWPWLGQRRKDRYLEARWEAVNHPARGRAKPWQERCIHGHDDWGTATDSSATSGARRICRTCAQESGRRHKAKMRGGDA